MSVGGGAARLTLPKLAKDDEGLYTLRIFAKDGTAEHSAYLFVSGTVVNQTKRQIKMWLRTRSLLWKERETK